MACYKKAVGEAINLGTGMEIKVKALADYIIEITGSKAGLVFKERRAWDKKTRLLASINKAKEILHYEPEMQFKDGLKHIYEWFNKNWDNIQASQTLV
jgi:nucleoside-diphosphate-sugar epimerase